MISVASVVKFFCLVALGFGFFLVPWCLGSSPPPSDYHGQVTFGGLPVPGASVKCTQGSKQFSTTTDQQGLYSFPDLAEGQWTIEIDMPGFTTVKQDVEIAANAPAANWELKMLPLEEIKADIKTEAKSEVKATVSTTSGVAPSPAKSEEKSAPANQAAEAQPSQGDLAERAADSLLINGSVNNAAASPFAQIAAFGNNRSGRRGLYTGGIGLILDNSALDARPFSFSGQDTPRPTYNRLTGVATFGGPLRIPHLFQRPPNFFVGYQWTRRRNATTLSALVPSLRERDGDLSQTLNALGQLPQIFDPRTGLVFPGSVIPQEQISSQARALLNLYPLPNVTGNPRYNYQIPIISNLHQDALQSRFEKTLNAKNQLYADFALQSTRTDSPNLFGFLDSTDDLGINSGIHWSHRFNQNLFLNVGYRFSRLAARTRPYWANRENVSGRAGITGNNQEPSNWGPPSLVFSSGVAGLSDAQSAFDRNQTQAISYATLWHRDRHNIRLGADFRRQQFNYLSQQNPRGTFSFTSVATQGSIDGVSVGGSDFADFLLGIPDTSSIAFGNADKYFRESVYDAYVADDWRKSPQFTLNAGIRWEYAAPITELYSRLVNLDLTTGFRAAAPVIASNPVGSLTGRSYSDSLIQPDKHGFEPRVGVAWRPISGSSVLIRAGYGVYYNTSVYQTIALQMAQQAPLSTSLSVQNSAACPLTLAHGFHVCPSTTPNTFAVDPNFRVGYAQNWQLTLQRDLPGSLQLNATYLGIKGTRGVQEFLPNTFPFGSSNPCPGCPVGFAYLTSNGNLTREAGQIQLRRRLHNGFTASVQYTFSKSIDNDSAVGGQGASPVTQTGPANSPDSGTVTQRGPNQSSPTIAQNWLDLRAERALSSFDQRHLLNMQLQYTTGMGLGGKALLSGWKGAAFKEWTILTQITVGSGLPQTPIYLRATPGTGVTGSLRPDYTGAPRYAAPPGLFLNPAAYTAPQSGGWGNAGRDTITGPAQFLLNTSIGRTFSLDSRFSLDLRMDSANLLNHVTFTAWDTTVGSTRFGLPVTANAMRSVQTTLRLRF